MALADTVNAIGMVSKLLEVNFKEYTGIQDIKIGRPQQAADVGECLNVFLYEIHLDEFLKNTPLNDGEKPPAWLVLKYLVTAFEDKDDVSDSLAAHKILGKAIRAISRDDFLSLDHLLSADAKSADDALGPNPSQLHATFDQASSDLIARLMQGPDDKLRLSVCFEVRPVMIAAAEPGDYSLLVGIDYTQTPLTEVLTEPLKTPVGIDVIPSLGSHINEISPSGFELGEEVTIHGTDLHLANLSVMLGSVELPVTMQQPDELRFIVDHAIVNSSRASAGSYPVTVLQTLPGTGKKRKSNSVIGNLVPTIRLATASGSTAHSTDLTRRFGIIDLLGTLLGRDADDTILAFYRDGTVYKMFDVFTSPPPSVPALPPPPPPPPVQPQPTKQLVMVNDDAVPAGKYKMILVVNGQQSPQSPEIELA